MSATKPAARAHAGGPDLELLGVALALCAYFVFGAFYRFVEIDEGFYLMGAKQVMAGRSIYSEFNYLQMPLFPYVWGLWMGLFGCTWHVARTLSGLLAASAGTLLFYHVRLRFGGRAARLTLACFCVTGLVFGLHTLAKTHAAGTLLLLLAYHLVATSSRERFRRRCFAAGVALGLSLGLRLLLVGALPALAYEIWRRSSRSGGSRLGIGLFCLGILVGLLPNLPAALADWHAFYWGNVVFHQIRNNDVPMFSQLGQKLETVLRLVALNTAEGGSSVQFGLLTLLLVWNIGLCASERRMPDGAVLIAVSLYLINMVPSPTFVQYHSYLVPFMLLGAVDVFTRCQASLASCAETAARRMIGPLFSMAVLAYVFAGGVDAVRFFITGRDVEGVDLREEWTLPAVRAVGQAVDRWTEPGDPVYSRFSGYLLESHALPVPGTEVVFSSDIANRISFEEAQRVKVLRTKDAPSMIRARVPVLVVLGNWPLLDEILPALLESGYVRVESLGRAELYKRP